jgi:hypothetical protein
MFSLSLSAKQDGVGAFAESGGLTDREACRLSSLAARVFVPIKLTH